MWEQLKRLGRAVRAWLWALVGRAVFLVQLKTGRRTIVPTPPMPAGLTPEAQEEFRAAVKAFKAETEQAVQNREAVNMHRRAVSRTAKELGVSKKKLRQLVNMANRRKKGIDKSLEKHPLPVVLQVAPTPHGISVMEPDVPAPVAEDVHDAVVVEGEVPRIELEG